MFIIRRVLLLFTTLLNTCLFTNKLNKKFLYKQLDDMHYFIQVSDTEIKTLWTKFIMTPKRKELSDSQRGQIIGAWRMSASLRKIAQTLDHPYSTVQKVIKAYNDHGHAKPSPRKGRPKIMTERNKRALLRIVKNDRKMILSGKILNLQYLIYQSHLPTFYFTS